MDFSFIIVNYQTINITNACLESIFNHCRGENFEVIVVDNASTDNSSKILKRNFKKRIKLIENKYNLGFARANNQGANIARGQYLFFLNSDTILENNILQDIRETFTKNSKIGAMAPQLITASGQKQISASGHYPQIIDLITNKFKKDKSIDDSQRLSVDWLSGAAIVIPRLVFAAVGAWDEKFFMYFEDIDICRRIKNLGYSIIVQRKIKLIHLSGKSLDQNRKRRQYYYQSQNYYFRKYHGYLPLLILKIVRWPYKLLMLTKN